METAPLRRIIIKVSKICKNKIEISLKDPDIKRLSQKEGI
jgi:hypothetical protein